MRYAVLGSKVLAAGTRGTRLESTLLALHNSLSNERRGAKNSLISVQRAQVHDSTDLVPLEGDPDRSENKIPIQICSLTAAGSGTGNGTGAGHATEWGWYHS